MGSIVEWSRFLVTDGLIVDDLGRAGDLIVRTCNTTALFMPGSPGYVIGMYRSVAEFVTDHFGSETLDYLAEPLLSGVYGGDPAQLSVGSVLPRFLQMEAKYGSLVRGVLAGRTGAAAKLDHARGTRRT